MKLMLALVLVLVSPTRATAQATTGTITGIVSDPSGDAVARASIHIRDARRGMERRVVTTGDGAFSSPDLPPGVYQVSADAPGLAAAVRMVHVEVGMTTHVNVALTLDPVLASVNVTYAAPLLRSDHHQVGSVVRREQIERQPLNGRDFLELARLEPGVTAPTRGTNNRTFVAMLGAGLQTPPRIGATRVTVDGANASFVGASGTSFKLGPDMVEEFQVATASLDVLTSLTSSGAVNVVTRSGGNDPAGGFLGLYRDHRVAAYPALRREPGNDDPSFRRHHASGWYGGPLRRDRIFIFAGAEQQLQSAVVSVQPGPTELRALGGVFASRSRSHQLTIRGDARVRSHQVFARYSHDRSNAFAPLNDRTDLLPSAWSLQRSTVMQSLVGFAGTFATRLLADVRASHFRIDSPERPANAQECAGCLGLGLPRVTIADADIAFGDARTLDFVGDRYQATATFTWHTDRHTTRLLADWEHALTRATIESPRSASLVLWSPRVVGDPGAPQPPYHTAGDVLQLPVQSYAVAVAGTVLERGFRPTRVFDQYRIALGDTWRIGPRVTANAGAAWTYEPDTLNHDLPKSSLLAPLLGSDRLHPPRAERNRFSAVAGVAWMATATGRTIVHAGGGRYFDPGSSTNSVNLVMERQALSPVGSRIATPAVQLSRPTATTGADVLAMVPATWADLERQLIPGNRDFTWRNIDATKMARNLSDPGFTVPYAVHANIGVQRQLTATLGVRVDVVWRRFERTFLTDIDYNRWNSASGSVLPPCSPDERRDLAAVCSNGPITFDATAGHARYRGVLARVDKRLSDRVQLLASYALSRFTGSNGTAAGAGFNLDDWDANDGPLPTDRRHVLNVSGVVRLPLALDVSWNIAAYSAPPLSVFVGGVDFNSDGVRNDLLPGSRVNQFRDVRDKALLERLVEQYNETQAERPLCCGQAPAPRLTLPPDYVFEDSFAATDVRIARAWRLRRLRLSLFADLFNVLNTANLAQVSGNLRSTTFGQPSVRGSQVFGSGGPRALQFGSRVGW